MKNKLFLSIVAVLISIFSTQAQHTQTINVSTPGDLNNLLGANVNTITDLVLTGTINDDDFLTIKQMVSLENLDLSDVDVVNQNIPDQSFKSRIFNKLLLPNSIKSIGMNAFEMSTISQKLVLPANLKKISKEAFFQANLKNGIDFSLCSNLEELGLYPFAEMQSGDGLIDLSTNNKLKKFDKQRINLQGAFSYYSGKVILPNEMTNVPDYSFARFTGEVVFPSALDSIGMNAFEMSTIAQELIIPSGVTYIAKDVFHEARLDGGIVLPSSLRKTGSGLFWATRVPSVDFSVCQDLEVLGFYAFSRAQIADGVVDLSTNRKLKSFGANPSTLEGEFTFYTGKVILPDNMKYLPDYAFAKFGGEVVLPESLTTIGSNAFLNSTISEIELPESVNYIGANAFLNCSNLEKIVSNDVTPPDLGLTVFSGVHTNSCSLVVPNASLVAYAAADQWKDFIRILPTTTEFRTIGQNSSQNDTEVSIYPNPTTDVLNITGDNITKVNVYSIDGRLVKTETNSNTVNVQNLSTGIYIVKITTPSGTTSQKIMKK